MSRRNFCHFILSLLNVLINNMGNIKKAEPDLKLWTSRPPHMGSKIQKINQVTHSQTPAAAVEGF